MASAHDQVVGYLAGKMQRSGFVIRHLEGPHSSVTMIKPDLPPRIITHRPDILAVRPADGAIGIGEAKTLSDLRSSRTKSQLLDFRQIVRENLENRLFIGVPANCDAFLRQLLSHLGFKLDAQIDIMVVPMELLR